MVSEFLECRGTWREPNIHNALGYLHLLTNAASYSFYGKNSNAMLNYIKEISLRLQN